MNDKDTQLIWEVYEGEPEKVTAKDRYTIYVREYDEWSKYDQVDEVDDLRQRVRMDVESQFHGLGWEPMYDHEENIFWKAVDYSGVTPERFEEHLKHLSSR